MADNEAVEAPHGRDDNNVPLAPYGLTVNGHPRKSNRGARPGQRQGRPSSGGSSRKAPSATPGNLTDVQRKGMLCELTDMAFVAPLASLSMIPAVAKQIGARQADALAGDALIISHFMPMVADGAILLSQTKPGALAWLDKTAENAPFILLANAGIQMAKALLENHMNPNPELAKAGRALASMRMSRVAEAVQNEARAMGVPVPDAAPAPAMDPFQTADPTNEFATV